MKKTVGIDLDTTLNNIEEMWLQLYNKDYNDNLSPDQLLDWDITKFIKPECGRKIYDYLNLPNFFYELDIKPYAKEAVEWLSEYFNLYIVTSYTPNVCVDKARWVEKHLPFINQRNIIFCNNKGALNFDYLIDDGGHNLESFKQTGIVFDMPYNRYLMNYRRAYNWLDIKMIFEELQAEKRASK